MKSFKKILMFAAASALTLTMGAVALTGCGGGGKDYSFEAENATLADATGQTQNTLAVQQGVEYKPEGDGPEITIVGYFATPGQTITWTVNAAEECDATIKVRGSSVAFAAIDGDGTVATMQELMGAMYGGPAPEGFDMETMKGYLQEVAAADTGVVLKVNNEKKTLSGKLPATTVELEEGNPYAIWAVYNTISCGELTVKVHLNKGENNIVLENVSGGFNVDKITVNAPVEITHTPVDNSSRVPQQQPQG